VSRVFRFGVNNLTIWIWTLLWHPDIRK